MQTTDDPRVPATITSELLVRMRRISARMADKTGQAVDESDLFEAGLLGLAQAARRWDEQRLEGEFDAYSLACARNTMRQELRDRDLLTRGQRKDVREVERAADRLAADLGRTPRSSEVARDLGLSFDAYRVIIESGGAGLAPLDDQLSAPPFASQPPASMQSTEARVDLLHRLQRVREEVDGLPPRLAEVVHLYYDEGLMQHEIGARLGVTEARICQLLRGAVDTLRDRITQPSEGGRLTLSPRRPT